MPPPISASGSRPSGEQNVSWLADYGLFMALKGNFGGGSWHAWPRDIRVREPGALAHYRGQVGEWATYHEYRAVAFRRSVARR